MAEIEEKDGQVKLLLDAIERRQTRNDEEWLVIVTTDHGGEELGHGPKTEPNRKIPLIIAGDKIKSGLIDKDC